VIYQVMRPKPACAAQAESAAFCGGCCEIVRMFGGRNPDAA
jgi:hypothetical protein